jgi:recombination protein RecT
MTQITPYQAKVANVRGLLTQMKGQLAMALPKHITADRMIRVALTCVQRTPKLLDCDPTSLLGAIVQSSQLGLEPDGITGQAYLIPYGNQVQFIPGYRGLVDLARRSGRVTTIYARAVHEQDEFVRVYGTEEKLEHVPSESPEPGPLTFAYAVARFKDGGVQFECMSRREIDAIRSRSQAANKGPWVTDYEEMAKKTVIRRLCKMLPLSPELATAVARDEQAERGIDQNLGLLLQSDDEIPTNAEVVNEETGEVTEVTPEVSKATAQPPRRAAAPSNGEVARGRHVHPNRTPDAMAARPAAGGDFNF